MKVKKIGIGLLLSLSLSLVACGPTVEAPGDHSNASESVESVASQSSQPASENHSEASSEPSASQARLSDQEEQELHDLVKQVQSIPVGSAGATLHTYEVFTHMANDFAFYKEKSEASKQFLAKTAKELPREEDLGAQLDAMFYAVLQMDENLDAMKKQVQDAGVQLDPKLGRSEMEAMLRSIATGAGLQWDPKEMK